MSALQQIISSYGSVGGSSGGAVTFDPAKTGSAITLSNGNKTATGTGGTTARSLATAGKTSGKFYFEFLSGTLASGTNAAGIQIVGNLTGDLGSVAGEIAYRSGGQSYNQGSYNTVTGSSWGPGDVVGVAVDFGAKSIWFSLNGTWQASGNPAAGTSAWGTYTTTAAMFPSGQVISGVITSRFSAADMTFSPPSGFAVYS